jgi:hypothetical protein
VFILLTDTNQAFVQKARKIFARTIEAESQHKEVRNRINRLRIRLERKNIKDGKT